jgi:prolyl oligopeptidase
MGVLEQFPVDDGDASLFSSYRVIRTGNRSHLAIITKESPVNPPLYYLLNTITNKLTPIWNMPPPNDEEEYDIQVHVATSADGTKVFYTVVSLKSVAQESKPTVLYGYGGFGNPVTLDYIDLYKPLWVDRGNRYVFAHLRGGNEFGSEWHLQATGINRHKVYEDAIAVAEDLIRNNLTSAEQLAITGHSNGGNLAAVVAVQRPDLFALSIPIAGVLDMTRYNLFTPGEMWVSEYGDPSDAEELDELIKYSPLHSIKDGKVYPTFLVLTAADDVRVDPMHSRKFAHALEQSGRIHFFESYNGGHKFYMGTFREDVIFRFSLIFTMLRTLEK